MVLWRIAQGEAPVYIDIDMYVQVGVLATVSVQELFSLAVAAALLDLRGFAPHFVLINTTW